MSAGFWQWECDVQAWWVRVVVEVGERYGTDAGTMVRMCRAGWRALLVLTWPQALVRWIAFRLWLLRGAPVDEG